jgi:hypothetical protein
MALTLDPSLLNNAKDSNTSPALPPSVAGKKKAPPSGPAWQRPAWQKGFELEEALSIAYQQAKSYLDKLLAPDGMAVDLSSQGGETIGEVRELETGRVLKSYNGLDMLRLYSHNIRPRGLVIDGTL